MLDNNQIGCRPCLFMQEDDDSIVKNILSLFGIIFVVFFWWDGFYTFFYANYFMAWSL